MSLSFRHRRLASLLHYDNPGEKYIPKGYGVSLLLIPVFWCPFFNFLVNKCHYTDKGKYDKRNDLNLNVF